ncbi:MAG TPA: DNA ligase D [Candidatus Kapabacteria bacterium]|nr:DNA ligase D [Candidatus Kapabacteria bacterium]
MALKEYQQKRSFNRTPEPSGKTRKTQKGALRFVVQKHHASRLHYDFRLELDGVLKSWAVPKGPSVNPSDKRLAMMVEDHPYAYRTFEGVIPKGNYGAGSVIIWDEGTYEAYGASDRKESELRMHKGLAKGHLRFLLFGKKLHGEFSLVHTHGRGENAWLLIKQKDAYARADDVTEKDRSVVSGRTVDELSLDLHDAPLGPFPRKVKPMLATLIGEPFDRREWIFEIKWDGYRAIAEKDGKQISLYSRKLTSLTKQFPHIVQELSSIPHDIVMDGELVAINADGKPDFSLFHHVPEHPGARMLYYVFDILYLDGHRLESLPLRRRKDILRTVLPTLPSVRYTDHIDSRGIDFFHAAKEAGLEGIIGKDLRSPYRAGNRGNEWVKIKHHLRQDAIICGFTEPRGGRPHLGALILGVYDQGSLLYVGHTGGGFTDNDLRAMRKRLALLERDRCPFPIQPVTNAPAHWVEPTIVCQVQFAEWTKDGVMRQPIFLGIRDDMLAKDVGKERVEKTTLLLSPGVEKKTTVHVDGHRVDLTNLEKDWWKEDGIRKKDIIAYYEEIAPIILPYLIDRPESMNRYPNGIGGTSFYHKDVQDAPPWVQIHPVYSTSEQRHLHYVLCQNTATLLYMVNAGCIEINPWNSTIHHVDHPDYLVIDLDPVDISFTAVIDVAKEMHRLLDALGLPSFCKTSGKTGLHIYVPTGAEYTYDQVKHFTEILMRLVHKKIPETTSIIRDPKKRTGKVYLDYLQNRRGQTMAAPYAVRPVPGATVSAPVAWKEVKKGLDPTTFTIRTIRKRLTTHGDLWEGFLNQRFDMAEALTLIDKKQ